MKIYVSKEDQMSQSFLHWRVLLCNNAKNWYLLNWSTTFDVKSLLFSLDSVLRQHSNNVIFLEEILVMQENEIWYFSMLTALSKHYNKVMFLKSIIFKNRHIIVISWLQYLELTLPLSDTVFNEKVSYVNIVSY